MPGGSTRRKAVRLSPLPARVLLAAAAQDKAKDPRVGSLSSKRHPSSYDPLSELPQTTGSRATRVPFLSLSEHPGSCGEQFAVCNIRLQKCWVSIHAWKKLGCKPLKCLQKSLAAKSFRVFASLMKAAVASLIKAWVALCTEERRSGKKNYKIFQTENPVKNNVGTGWSLSNLCTAVETTFFRVYLNVHMCVYTRRESEEKPPDPGSFSLAPLQNIGGFLYFCPGGKEAKGLYWESCKACPSREPQMLRKPRRWCGLCIGSAVPPTPPLPQHKAPRPQPLPLCQPPALI